MYIPYRLDIFELLNRTSSRIVRVATASGGAQEFRIVLPPKVKIKNSTSSVYSSQIGPFINKLIHLKSHSISNISIIPPRMMLTKARARFCERASANSILSQ